MPWKMDGETIVVQDGHPVWVYEDGKESPFNAESALKTIKDTTAESMSRKEKIKGLEAQLAPFQDLDPKAAKEALETVKNLEDKQLIDAGEVDKVKKNLAESYEANLSNTKKSYEDRLAEREARIQLLETNTDELLLLGAFERSEFLREKTYLTPDIAYATFKKNLRVEYDNNQKPYVVGYVDDEKLFSRREPGKLASPEESIQMIIDAYPQKERIMRGSGTAGSGGGPGGMTGDPNDLQAQLVAAQKAGNIQKSIALKRQIAEQNKK